ncbi:PDZ and LIM domain protein 7 [Oryzias latipes]|uniref:PDZ and LIM domain protein 7 n=1 Tax=Oryzias latipes TaxID=8090 RepID=A0A3B3IGY9_ORYLA|nr:PDZ and LIM domain protein 7 [Oryzias latipes]XP_011478629.1 PDZ and LIM domain protein 7 [Oryzias latipes]XP_011478631.1 PDZ and LIM domain protein 7 [Oryzias latipes]XP_011478632.1 PDZ and LIM domain protein 7 [Oryzias latipes]XP_020562338.1 PDZ and LIM domain protein 7 [Oryzias latipes]XP_023815056.1 PDZ and LIM domain protein 7 [Oryzias latipes]
MNLYTVTLNGPAPWGFRLQGGKDFSMPLTVSRLTPGGKAAQAGVGVGDWVVSICDANAEDMTHVEAQNKIRAATDSLTLTLSRGSKLVEERKDSHTAGSAQPKYSFAPSTTINKMARPFSAGGGSASSGPVIKPVAYSPKLNTPHSQGNASTQQPQNGLEPTTSSAKTQAAEKPDGSKTGAAAAAAARGSGPTSRPPWVTDPGFADRFHPDKTSTVVTQHQQPAQLTPKQNRSSIMQAAQQAPEDSNRTPVCGACNKIIRGRYLVALGRSWHPEEFTCSQCKAVLEEGGFFEERGAVYCTKCHDNRYAPNCAKCKKKITGEIMHALKMTYHVECFKCAACKAPIRNQAFYMEEGEPYCEKDYEKMFGTKCHGCDFKIDAGDRFLEALGFSWHDTCFVCALCQINLEGKTFYSKKDKPLCKSHAFAPV